MPKTSKSSKQVCEFCTFGTEVRVCGRLWHSSQPGLTVTAHHKCMQYSAGLVQYKNEFTDFGNFDPKEVKKEVKRGNKLKCHICKNRDGSATAGCALNICPHSFHFLCAKQDPNRTTLVKKINVYQGEGEGVLDEYVIFCKVSHKHAFDKKRDEVYKYVDSSDDEAPWNRYGYGHPFPSPGKNTPGKNTPGKKGAAASKKKSPQKEVPGKLAKRGKSRSPEAQDSSETSPKRRKSPPLTDEELLNDPKLTGENELKIVLKKCSVDSLSTSVSLDDIAAADLSPPKMDTPEKPEESVFEEVPVKTEPDLDVENVEGLETKAPEFDAKDSMDIHDQNNSFPGSSFEPIPGGGSEDVVEPEPVIKSESCEEEDVVKTPTKRGSPEDGDSPSIKVQKLSSSPVTPKSKGYRRHPFFAQTDGHMDPKSPISNPAQAQAQAVNILAPLKQVVQKVWQSMQGDTTPTKQSDTSTSSSSSALKPIPFNPDLGKTLEKTLGKTLDPVGSAGKNLPPDSVVPRASKLPPLSECVSNPAASQRVIGTLMKESDHQPAQDLAPDDCMELDIKSEPETDTETFPEPHAPPLPPPYTNEDSGSCDSNSPVKNTTSLLSLQSSQFIDVQHTQFTQTIKNEPDEVLKHEIKLGNNGFNACPSQSKEGTMLGLSSESQTSPSTQQNQSSLPLGCAVSQAPVVSHSYKPLAVSTPSTPRLPLKTSPLSSALKLSVTSPLVTLDTPATITLSPVATNQNHAPHPPSLSSHPPPQSLPSHPPSPSLPSRLSHPSSATMSLVQPSIASLPSATITSSLASANSSRAPVTPVVPSVSSLLPSTSISQDSKLDLQQQANIIDPSDIRIASITPVSKSPQHSNPLLDTMAATTLGLTLGHTHPTTLSQTYSLDTLPAFSPKKTPLAKTNTNTNSFSPNKPHYQTSDSSGPASHSSSSPSKLPSPSISLSQFEPKKSELTERLHGIMSASPAKDTSPMTTPRKKVPCHVTKLSPTKVANSPKPAPRHHASTRSDAVLCMVNLPRIDRATLDSIYASALNLFGVKRHQVLMKYMPASSDANAQRTKFDGLLHLKELAESLSSKDLQSVQRLALDKNMQVYADKHKTFSFDMYPTLLDIVKAILQESHLKYNYSIAKMLRLQKDDNAVAFMLHLNDSTDPGFKVRAVYNNIFIWNPNTQVNFDQELCDPEREYATIQSWLDKQITGGICPYYKPSDSLLLRPNDQSVLRRLKEKILELTYDQPQPPPSTARKVYFVGPMDESVIPSASAYLRKCIPRIADTLDNERCPLALCVVAADSSLRSIHDVCAPLPGFDMNILTVFDPSEFCPSCFVLKIARRKNTAV